MTSMNLRSNYLHVEMNEKKEKRRKSGGRQFFTHNNSAQLNSRPSIVRKYLRALISQRSKERKAAKTNIQPHTVHQLLPVSRISASLKRRSRDGMIQAGQRTYLSLYVLLDTITTGEKRKTKSIRESKVAEQNGRRQLDENKNKPSHHQTNRYQIYSPLDHISYTTIITIHIHEQ